MQAVEDQPAVLTTGDGKTTNCETVFVGTGGHRLAPGFQMRGYTVLNDGELETQLLYVECKGATADAGSKLSIDYVSFSGDLYDYEPEANKAEGVLELNLDEVVSDLVYPVAVPVDGLIQDTGNQHHRVKRQCRQSPRCSANGHWLPIQLAKFQPYEISIKNPHWHPAGHRFRRNHLWHI